ncbi:MAG: hypothetical protein V3R94_03130 [Acidobacteriota bacterium]
MLHKPLGHYLRQTRWGIGLLLAVAILRFLMLPLFQVPYEEGTHWVSLTVLLPVIMVVYSVVVARAGGTFRDVLGIALCLGFASALFVILGIGIDGLGGVNTYYSVGEGDMNPASHMLAHGVAGIVFTLLLWGVGALTYLVAGGRSSRAVVTDATISRE